MLKAPRPLLLVLLSLVAPLLPAARASAAVLWIEAEKPATSTMHRHPWWYDKVDKAQLSGGDFISNWSDQPGEAEYKVAAPAAGEYAFWVRANPVGTKLVYRLNGGDWTATELAKDKVGETNIAADQKPDLRFIAWEKVGGVTLRKGENTVAFRMDSANNNHGMLDCFVLANEPFEPHGIRKPGETASVVQTDAEGSKWFAFDPKADAFEPSAAFDLRSLNEKRAGDGGFIAAKGAQFVHSGTGQPVRFWAVNGIGDAKTPEQLRHAARVLAKHGVNLIRIHGGYYDKDGKLEPEKIQHAIDVVGALKAEGIYSHFSIYFPIWMEPSPGNPVLKGYDGHHHPFATHYFDPEFQKMYQGWWTALLTTPGRDGKKLIDEPAVFGGELVNEDSYFFWTFSDANVPDPELKILEKQFGDWSAKQYGSIDAALKKWNGQKANRDAAAEGRLGFRPLWNMFNERSPRDRDAARFLTESQYKFYHDQEQFLRKLGFKGLVTGSNWTTADARFLGPLDKYTYTACDFIDRHGYFDCDDKGEGSGWSVRAGHTYFDRSALRFEGGQPGKPRDFMNTIMDVSYDNKPSMVSEISIDRPNRYRSEAPLYYACYGALQDSDCIVHFAFDTDRWSVSPGYFMQPWTLMTPAAIGQFPAAASIYRRGLVSTGEMVADLNLKAADIEDLKGTPLPQGAALDELRARDAIAGARPGESLKAGATLDPLLHYVGRSNVSFTETGGPPKLADLSPFIDRSNKTVASSTKQLKLDWGKGVLTIAAPAVQGVSGNLKDAGTTELPDLSVSSDLPLGHIVAVSLDDKPLATSAKILLQVMSEEKPDGFRTEDAGNGTRKITDLGHDPWMVRELSGAVKFKRRDAAKLKVTPLDANGYAAKPAGGAGAATEGAAEIKLAPGTIYYLVGP